MSDTTSPAFDSWCIIELFGHNKIAGRVTEQVIGGQSFVRVDVPKTKRFEAFTRFFGSGAIYSITPVSEEIARSAVDGIYAEPVTVYIERKSQLEAPSDDDDLLPFDEEDEDE